MAAEEKRKAQREQAFIPPVEEKPKKETKKKGMMILFLYYYFLVVSMVMHTTSFLLHVHLSQGSKSHNPLSYCIKFQFAGFFELLVTLECNSKMGMLLCNQQNRVFSSFHNVFAENDSKVDVEAFKKKIKNSQVRSVSYRSLLFVCFLKKKCLT